MNSNPLYLALGANLGDPARIFQRAVERIDSDIGRVLKVSQFYRTAPLNPPELEEISQPEFLNAALVCESSLEPQALIETVLKIERELGRDRSTSVRWGPRVIDIDVLMYGALVLDSPDLRIPHPEMHKRDFVLGPLCEIAPDAVHPLFSKTIRQLLDQLPESRPGDPRATKSLTNCR